MKATILGLGLLATAAAMTACGGSSSSSSKTNSTPAAPTASSATKASGGATVAAPTSTAAATSGGDGGTCKYLSDADAATLLPNAGPARVKTADSPAGKVTTCAWGTGTGLTDKIVVLVTELKIDAALAAAKQSVDETVTETIDGLGDAGGFSEKNGADGIGVLFIKGKTTVLVSVGTAGASPNAVAALAKKIAAKI